MKILNSFVGVLIIFVLFCGIAGATDYYVSPTGNNSAAGGIDTPFLSITHACSVAKSGDSVNIFSGTYTESAITIPQDNITVQKYNGTVLVQGTGQNYGLIAAKNYTTIDGLNFNGFVFSVAFLYAHDGVLRNTSITNSTYGAYMLDYYNFTLSDFNASNVTDAINFVRLNNSQFNNFNFDNVTYGIDASQLNNSTITDFTISNSYTGIYVIGSNNTTCTDFYINNMSSDGLKFTSPARNVTVTNGSIISTIKHGAHFYNGVYDVNVQNITFRQNWHNQLDFHSNTAQTRRIYVTNCSFGYYPDIVPTTYDVVSIYLHTYNVSDVVIRNCMFNYASRPIEMYNARNISITSCNFSNIQRNNSSGLGKAMLLGGFGDGVGSDAYPERGVFNLSFENNTIAGPSLHGIGVYAGDGAYPLGSKETYISNVTFRNNLWNGTTNDHFFFETTTILRDFKFYDQVENNSNTQLVYQNVSPKSVSGVEFLDTNLVTRYPLYHSFPFLYGYSNGRVFSSSVGTPYYTSTGSKIYETSLRTYTPYNYSAIPESGTATVTPNTPTGNELANFTAAGTNGVKVDFAAWGNLTPGKQYRIIEDGVEKLTQVANSSGYITWNNSVWSTHTYIIEPTCYYVSTLGTDEYTTDGTNDHVEINNALVYASEHPGTTVYLRGPATYWINSTLTVPNNTVFTGDQTAEVKLINSAGWARYIGLVEPLNRVGNNITICNFSIDGNIDNQTCNAGEDYYTVLRFDNTTNLTVHDMNLHNSKNDGIRVHLQTFSEGVGNINIYNNTINTCSHDGVYLWKVSGANISNNNILPSTNSGIRTDGCNHLRIFDNYVHVPTYTGGAGIYVLLGSTIMKANDIEIYNNTVEHTNLAGIYLAGYNQYTLADASGAKIHHNIVKNCGKHVSGGGYTTYNWGGGISIQGFNNTTVENNVVDGCYRNGIYLNDSYITSRGSTTVNYKFVTNVKNNIVVNTLAHPSYSGSGYGIETLNANNYSVVMDYNDFWNNTAGGYDNFTAGTNDISSDPLFTSLTAFKIKYTSPCKDAGDPTSDYSNEPENNGDRIDIGAYGNTVNAPYLPTTAFTATPLTGIASTIISFTDSSSGATAYAWDFENDGSIDSTERNTTHAYTTAGTYTVNLTAVNEFGSNSEVKTGYITITENSGTDPLMWVINWWRSHRRW